MINLKIVEIDALAMITLCKEYDKLMFIPDFKTRIDTAKIRFEEVFLARCSCNGCKESVRFIKDLKFYEDEQTI